MRGHAIMGRRCGRVLRRFTALAAALRPNDQQTGGGSSLNAGVFGRQGAREAFTRAVALAPHSAEHHHNLACLCKDMGLNPEAVVHFRAALRLDPDNAAVFCGLAHSLQLVCDWHGCVRLSVRAG